MELAAPSGAGRRAYLAAFGGSRRGTPAYPVGSQFHARQRSDSATLTPS